MPKARTFIRAVIFTASGILLLTCCIWNLLGSTGTSATARGSPINNLPANATDVAR